MSTHSISLSTTLALALAMSIGCKPKPKAPTPPLVSTPPTETSQGSAIPTSPESSVPAPPPSKSGASIALTPQERDAAIKIEDRTLKYTLAANETKVFSFEHNPATGIFAVNSNKLDNPGDTFQPGKPGYALYDAQCQLIGTAHPAWNDAPNIEREPGTYFIKLVGPGEIDIQIQ